MKKCLAFCLSLVFAFTASAGVLVLGGCNSASLLAKVEDFQPVVIDALNLYCTIKPADGNCALLAQKIGADYTVATQLWSDYLKNVTNGTATVEAYNILNAAFSTYEQDASQIFSLVSALNNPTVSAVVASAELLFAAIEVMFPSAPSAAGAKAKPAKFSALAQPNYDKAWLSSWINTFNGRIDAAQKAYPTAKLAKVHLHHLHLGTAQLGW